MCHTIPDQVLARFLSLLTRGIFISCCLADDFSQQTTCHARIEI